MSDRLDEIRARAWAMPCRPKRTCHACRLEYRCNVGVVFWNHWFCGEPCRKEWNRGRAGEPRKPRVMPI